MERSFRRALRAYNCLLVAALFAGFPLWLPWMLAAPKRRKNFLSRLGAGLGDGPHPSGSPVIWFHAVSVGETFAAVPLVRAARREWPAATIVFSTVTLTGRETALKALEGTIDRHVFFPFDLPPVCDAFADRLRPDVVVVLETEIWPNFLATLRRRRIPALLVNGRLSDRSLRGYLRARSLFGGAMATFSAVAAQTADDAGRYVAILGGGTPPPEVVVTGNMKFDTALPDLSRVPLATCMASRSRDGIRWIVAGSTHAGEEPAVLAAYRSARAVDPRIRLLLAPRHPERFDEVERLATRDGWSLLRRSRTDLSAFPGAEGDPDVLLLDTMGELGAAYAAAGVAFVGGSLVPVGGHNVIEPALFGVPVVTGPHLENFREVESLFREEEALTLAEDPGSLGAIFAAWALDPSLLDARGKRGKALLDRYRGATGRNLALLRKHVRVRP